MRSNNHNTVDVQRINDAASKMHIRSADDINYKIIGQNLQRQRKKLGYTQSQIAGIVEMNSYGNYERGSQRLSLWRILQLCDVLQCSPSCIMEGCSSAFVPEWNTGMDTSSPRVQLLNQLREKSCGLSEGDLGILLNLATGMANRSDRSANTQDS